MQASQLCILTMTSFQHTAPVHSISHPLSPDEPPPSTGKGRKSRIGTASLPRDVPATNTNYLTLKAQLEKPEVKERDDIWDGSVRGKARRASHGSISSALSPERPPPPLIIVAASPSSTEKLPESGQISVSAQQILQTQWHTYSDSAIQHAISRLSTTSDSPADSSDSSHPYHTALRALSSNLSRMRIELEESRRKLEETESARRARADFVLTQYTEASEHEIARRVVASIFSEEERDVRRKLSFMVCSFLYITL